LSVNFAFLIPMTARAVEGMRQGWAHARSQRRPVLGPLRFIQSSAFRSQTTWPCGKGNLEVSLSRGLLYARTISLG
jgi:hypothetical protein